MTRQESEGRTDHNRCAGCDEDFSRLELFDEHRAGWRISKTGEMKGACLGPLDMDLVKINGVWYDEAGVKRLAHLAAARSTKASFKLEHGE